MDHQQYTEFFRNIAVRHKEIRHREHSMHFARLILSADPFLSTNHQLNEFLEGIKNKLLAPAMLLASYQAQYVDNRSDNVEKVLAGRLIIIDEVKPANDYALEEAVLTRTERIGEECLAYAEYQLSPTLCPPLGGDTGGPPRGGGGFLEWSSAGSEKVASLTERNFFGTAFDFAIKVSAQEQIQFNPQQFDLE